MSIDMQFSLLSSDLDAAKPTTAKVRSTEGGCGDKGFGDVFEEKLQQATEPEQGAEITQSILLTGQEVAAMLSDSVQGTTQNAELAAGAENAEGVAGVKSTESPAILQPGAQTDLDETAVSIDENSDTNTNHLASDDSGSLFQLIGKARDYAAELGAVPAQKDPAVQLSTAELAALTTLNADKDVNNNLLLLTEDQAVLPIEPLLQGQGNNTGTQASDSATQAATQAATKQQGLADASQAFAGGQLNAADNSMSPDKASSAQSEALPQLLPQQQDKTSTDKLTTDAADKPALSQVAAEDKNAATKQQLASAEQAGLHGDLVEGKAAVTAQDSGKTAQLSAAQLLPQNDANAAAHAARSAVSGLSDTTAPESAQINAEQADLSGTLLTPALQLESGPNKNNNKTAAPSFAEFQKSANAALAQQQKQQQTENQQLPGQQGNQPADSPISDMIVAQPGLVTHEQPALAVSLGATEKALGSSGLNQSGSQSGGQSGHHAQSSFSQILAARQADSQIQTLPTLSLLEPTAANQLKERVMFQVNQKIQSADIRLAPEELGSVQIKINLQQEQLSVQFVVQQSAAKEALEQQMPRLKELLQEQGMALTDGQVHQQQREQQGREDERSAATGHNKPVAAGQEEEALMQQVQVAVSDRMVDYYA